MEARRFILGPIDGTARVVTGPGPNELTVVTLRKEDSNKK